MNHIKVLFILKCLKFKVFSYNSRHPNQTFQNSKILIEIEITTFLWNGVYCEVIVGSSGGWR